MTCGEFDPEVFQLFFGGTLGLFIAGFCIGLIISQIRRVSR